MNILTTERILTAIQFAIRKHNGQTRKNKDGTPIPYIEHPVETVRLLVKYGVTDEVALVAAVLHDTLEDTTTTVEELEDLFGSEVTAVVKEVTDDKTLGKNERKEEQIRRAPKYSKAARNVKLADCTHNIFSILTHPPKWNEESIRGYIRVKRRLVDILADSNQELANHFYEMAETVLRR